MIWGPPQGLGPPLIFGGEAEPSLGKQKSLHSPFTRQKCGEKMAGSGPLLAISAKQDQDCQAIAGRGWGAEEHSAWELVPTRTIIWAELLWAVLLWCPASLLLGKLARRLLAGPPSRKEASWPGQVSQKAEMKTGKSSFVIKLLLVHWTLCACHSLCPVSLDLCPVDRGCHWNVASIHRSNAMRESKFGESIYNIYGVGKSAICMVFLHHSRTSSYHFHVNRMVKNK